MKLVSLFKLSSVLLLLFSSLALSVTDVESFPNQELKLRYQQLTQELRCPKCQNQNLADSDSMIAQDLRAEVRRLLLEGKADRQIEDHLIARYGEFVLYKPRLNKSTQLLWYAPFLLLIVGVFVLIVVVLKQRKAPKIKPLATDDKQRLEALLGHPDEEPDQ